jgi:hypothetical protein
LLPVSREALASRGKGYYGSTEVSLLADAIGLGDPRDERGVNVLRARYPKVMDVIPPRDRLDAQKTRVPVNRPENKMTAESTLPNRDCHEGHVCMEGDSGLLGQNRYRTARCHGPSYALE